MSLVRWYSIHSATPWQRPVLKQTFRLRACGRLSVSTQKPAWSIATWCRVVTDRKRRTLLEAASPECWLAAGGHTAWSQSSWRLQTGSEHGTGTPTGGGALPHGTHGNPENAGSTDASMFRFVVLCSNQVLVQMHYGSTYKYYLDHFIHGCDVKALTCSTWCSYPP